jgi:hypothetical protein
MRNRRTSASDSKGYPEFCLQAATRDDLFAIFRSTGHAEYGRILEHFSREDGQIHLEVLRDRNPALLESLVRISQGEKIGTPDLYDYGTYGLLAPSTIRYTRHLGDLTEKFGPLDGLDVVEIGVGYGGLCKVTFDSFTPGSYTLVDLPEALRLAERFLRASLTAENFARVRFEDGTRLQRQIVSDLAISNCAFSECLPSVQRTYIETILGPARRGSLLINLRRESLAPLILWRSLKALHPTLITSDEKPITNPTNFMLNWGTNPSFAPQATRFSWAEHQKLHALLGDRLYGVAYKILFRLKPKKRMAAVSRLFGLNR